MIVFPSPRYFGPVNQAEHWPKTQLRIHLELRTPFRTPRLHKKRILHREQLFVSLKIHFILLEIWCVLIHEKLQSVVVEVISLWVILCHCFHILQLTLKFYWIRFHWLNLFLVLDILLNSSYSSTNAYTCKTTSLFISYTAYFSPKYVHYPWDPHSRFQLWHSINVPSALS